MTAFVNLPPRLPAWPELLAAHLHAAQHQPFEWAVHDCCTFAAAAVQAITGADPMADLRATYASQLQAARVLKGQGGLHAAVSARLGPPKPVLLAGRGDVVLFEMADTGSALGICTGTHFAAPGPLGLAMLPMQASQAAWSV